jgi:hypothetical protein
MSPWQCKIPRTVSLWIYGGSGVTLVKTLRLYIAAVQKIVDSGQSFKDKDCHKIQSTRAYKSWIVVLINALAAR